MAVKLARDHGVPVNRSLAAHPTTATLASWQVAREQYLLGEHAGRRVHRRHAVQLTALVEEGVAPSAITDAVSVALANTQRRDGSWNLPIGHSGGGLRPRLAASARSASTALAIRGLSVYAPKGREAETKLRLARALAFLRGPPLPTRRTKPSS